VHLVDALDIDDDGILDAQPGGNDARRRNIVMMDDFIYGEPVEIQ
jgi:hypothetical protein